MTTDWWVGVLVGGLVMTFVYGIGTIVLIAAIGAGRHDRPMDGSRYTGPGSDSD